MIKRRIERIIRIFRILVFATYSLQFMEFGRKYFVMSKKNSTFVAERRRQGGKAAGGRFQSFNVELAALPRETIKTVKTIKTF